ncbi:MAG TPA: tryptophan synthase subunit beta [Planctomycetes bacterium]|nr:tryptophan synthase subunit beta [Planctomycetota bacterium]
MKESVFQPILGAFGEFGGRYASELLHRPLAELARARKEILPTPDFQAELQAELRRWAGRPTPLTYCSRFSRDIQLEVYLKREDLLHGGAHKTNNAVGQALLARRLGKQRLIAETGAGQHGVACAMAGARYGFDTTIYMGAVDVERQRPNVRLMELCGAKVRAVTEGAATLKEAINAALRAWTEEATVAHYLLGSVCGPDPFPSLVADLQSVIGREARHQMLEAAGDLPDALVACVGGGSNAAGLFRGFAGDPVRRIGVEAAGEGLHTRRHGATLARGRPGLLHGARTYVLQDEDGQTRDAYSLAAGLDYPGVGPEHAHWHETHGAQYVVADDEEALAAFEHLSRREGIVPAFESAHALAFCRRAVREGSLPRGARVLVNLSGSGRKDLPTYFARYADRGDHL